MLKGERCQQFVLSSAGVAFGLRWLLFSWCWRLPAWGWYNLRAVYFTPGSTDGWAVGDGGTIISTTDEDVEAGGEWYWCGPLRCHLFWALRRCGGCRRHGRRY
jgi:hypothetical protein